MRTRFGGKERHLSLEHGAARGFLSGIALVFLFGVSRSAAFAQSAAAEALRDPAGYPFRTPSASPLEPLTRIAIVHTSRDTASRTVALPDLGDRLPFWIRRDPGGPWELAGAVVVGVFSRFDLEGSQNEFIEAHYRAAFQLRARYRGLAARASLYHVSSHLGDEFLQRTGRRPISTSREGVELLLQAAPVAGLLVYGGPGYLLRSTRDFERGSARAGFEWTPSSQSVRFLVPYLTGEIFSWDELDWDPIIALETGLGLGPHVRVGFEYGSGPSRAEQFFREHERVVGLLFSFRR
ncbi:MAG: DUF1207 domain-containing protein [Gemmatimonadota bacterium]